MANQGWPQHSGWASPSEARRSGAGSLVLGAVLVLIGVLFLVQEFTGLDIWHWSWPLMVVAVGALFFFAMFSGGKSASGMAIPASIVTTTGLILLFQNTFNLWQTWAYAWTLIFPTAAGLGMWLMGWWGDHPEPRRVGRRMAEIGFIMFLGFAAFFELLLNLSGVWYGSAGGTIVAALLIVAGVYILSRRTEGTRGH